MQCGVSTACFYPGEPLEGLRFLAESGVPVVELFINTFSEMKPDYVSKLLQVQKAYNVRVSSLHPFTGVMEGLLFASRYPTRFSDGVALYRGYFEVCRALGADKMVFHGDNDFNTGQMGAEEYAECFRTLAGVGREYGVTLCHENVAYCRLNTPERVRELRTFLGDDAAFVLDTKQVRRLGGSLKDMVDAMGGAIRQVHISDHSQKSSCMLPGRGNLDIRESIGWLRDSGYDDDLIIEVYDDNYGHPSELVEARNLIEAML